MLRAANAGDTMRNSATDSGAFCDLWLNPVTFCVPVPNLSCLTRVRLMFVLTVHRCCLALAAACLLVTTAVRAADYTPSGSIPTAEDYVAHIGGKASIVESGDLLLSRHKVSCGVRPVVLDPGLDDFAAAYDGFIILNPKKLEGLPPAVSLWIYSHECGHQFKGPDEDEADCFAAQRGRRQGWLTPAGVEEICNFISPSHGDVMHFSGPQRCDTVRRCYGDKGKF